MKYIKKIILAIILFLSFTSNCYADLISDIDGIVPSGGSGGGGAISNFNAFTLNRIEYLKVSLVDIIGSNPNFLNSIYYGSQTANNLDKIYSNNGEYNALGAWNVYGVSGTDNIEGKIISYNNRWFLSSANGTYFNATNTKNNIAIYIQEIFDNLKKGTELEDYNLNSLTNEQKIYLKENYRIIIEPVYRFWDNSTNGNVSIYATIKGMALYMKNNLEKIKGTLSELNGINLGMYNYAYNIYSSKTHGNIGPYNNNIGKGIDDETWENIYREVSNINQGNGYGIFYIVEEEDCDPTKECCYSQNGKYNSDYSGVTSNYKCIDGINGEECQKDKLESCAPTINAECSPINMEYNCDESNPDEMTISQTCKLVETTEIHHEYSMCDGTHKTATSIAKQSWNIVQSGKFNFTLDREIYSGGGFTFDFSYNVNSIYFEYAETECPTMYYVAGVSILVPVACPNPCAGFSGAALANCAAHAPRNPGPCFENKCVSQQISYTPTQAECDSAYEKMRKVIAQKYADSYQGFGENNVDVKSKDSNDETSIVDTTVEGTVNCSGDESLSNEVNVINSKTCDFNLKDANINKQTSLVDYGNVRDYDSYIIESEKYFTPLKYQGEFPISVKFTDISMTSLMDWNAIYSCDVNCISKFYDLNNGGFKFYYRPIKLDNPFPNNREVGFNWKDWINVQSNKDRLKNTYSEDKLEYVVELDNASISTIKSNNYNSYIGFIGINESGTSEFINSYIDSNSNVFTRWNSDYCPLGEYNYYCSGGGGY